MTSNTKSCQRKKKSSHKFKKIFLGSLFLLLVAISVLFTGHAGVHSKILGFFHQNANAETLDATSIHGVNSQNMQLLQAATNINPNMSRGGADVAIVGGSALLAEAGPSGTIADIEEGHTSGQISTYVVQEGDSLSKISVMFDVSMSTLISANDLKNGVIRPGQTLIILPISGVQYKVQKGDTLKSIVSKYKADLDEVMDYNGLNEDSVLVAGSTLLIPDAETSFASQGSTHSSSKTASKVKGSNAPTYAGYYTRPINGGVKTQGLHGYNGVDLANIMNTPIHAAAAGTVIIAITGGWNYGYGNYVVIAHPNGTQTLYAHANKILVSQGEHVSQGETIALLGSTGNSTGPHVHFEIRGAKNPF